MEESMIDQAGMALLGILTDAMVPGLLVSKDDISMAAPYQEQRDFRVGVYLYDIQDHSTMGGAGMERLNVTDRRLPPKAIELHFLIFVNQSVPFNRARAREEEELLEAVLRALYNTPRLEFYGGGVGIAFSFLKLAEKTALWQSFSKPLQPAIYVTLSPVLIPSGRILSAPQVRKIEYHYQKQE